MPDNNPVAQNRALQYLKQQIEQAGPVQQVVMLLDGGVRFTLQAKEAIARGDIEARHNANQRVMDIIAYLMDILDTDKGGAAAIQLRTIYMGILKKLMRVDFENNPTLCDEVVDHLRQLRMAWGQMPAGATTPSVVAAG
jgi:flagellar biosynthetic protein FliS